MANTTNLDLVKPAGTDKALVSVINANSDKIDAFAGTTNQALSNIVITNQYNTVLDAVNEYKATKKLPFTIQKYGNSAYTDLPSELTNTCEWCVICYGSNERLTIQLTAFSGASSNNGKTYTANIGTTGTYIFTWDQLALKSDVTAKRYSVTTTNNANVSPYGAFVQMDIPSADRTNYGRAVSAIAHASSTNPATCMITGGDGGVLVYSHSAATFNIDVVFCKNYV